MSPAHLALGISRESSQLSELSLRYCCFQTFEEKWATFQARIAYQTELMIGVSAGDGIPKQQHPLRTHAATEQKQKSLPYSLRPAAPKPSKPTNATKSIGNAPKVASISKTTHKTSKLTSHSATKKVAPTPAKAATAPAAHKVTLRAKGLSEKLCNRLCLHGIKTEEDLLRLGITQAQYGEVFEFVLSKEPFAAGNSIRVEAFVGQLILAASNKGT